MKKQFNGNEEKGGIYRITNVKNGKFYIGSAKNFKKRAYGHEFCLRNNKHDNGHLQASWNKWGEDAFVFEVVEIVEGNKGERYKVEQKYIDNLIKEKRWDQTFNISKKTVENERSCFSKNPEETRRKRSEILKKLHSDLVYRTKYEEGRKKAAQKRIKTYQFISPEGVVTTITNLKEFCRKHQLSDSSMHHVWTEKNGSYRGWTKYNPSKTNWRKRTKPVYQYSIDGKVLIKKWNSAKEAAEKTGCAGSNISLCANGKLRTCGGFVWKFDDKPIDPEKLKVKKIGRTPRPVFQYNLDGSFIKKWNSVSEAAQVLGCSRSLIHLAASGKIGTAKGFVWRYDNDPPKSK